MNTPVYFISDVHLRLTLNNDEKQRRKKFYKVLDKICKTGGTCFFVGDLFDFYFEYPDLIPKAYSDFYDKAMSLKKQGIGLHFLTGNHDYWTEEFMENVIMDKVYLDDTQIEIDGKRFYLTHGDGLLSWDYGYRLLKKIILHKVYTKLYKLVHKAQNSSIKNNNPITHYYYTIHYTRTIQIYA